MSISGGEHMQNKDEVRRVIEETLTSGSKMPGLFDLPKILGVKSKLESCASVGEVVCVLEEHRSLISKSFGLSDSLFDSGVDKVKRLESAA
ncbi:MAG: hypothetical protein C0406_04685 [Sideroxydans sp.]|nr:hypothetical protein [Sideroxydans sp.]